MRPRLGDPATALALAATHLAGEEIRRLREVRAFALERKRHGELVTSADLASDSIIRRQLREIDPCVQILSEEGEEGDIDWARDVWIVDPMDGTVNYVHGSRQVAISLALVVGGEVKLGVVHAPFRRESFLGLQGGGAWHNVDGRWRPLRLGEPASLDAALVGTGFPHDRSDLGPLMRRLQAVLLECQDVRRLGSPCLDICRVATGQLDVYYETVFPWDAAAACLVAREAGARTGAFMPTSGRWPAVIDGENLLVTAPELFDVFAELVRSA